MQNALNYDRLIFIYIYLRLRSRRRCANMIKAYLKFQFPLLDTHTHTKIMCHYVLLFEAVTILNGSAH